MLHSDRHFTGSSTSFLVGFSSLVLTCSNELLRGVNCTSTDILPLQFHSLATLGESDTTDSSATGNEVAKSTLIVGEKREFFAHVPKGVDLIHITLSFQDFPQSALCSQQNTTIVLELLLYAEIGDQDRSHRRYKIDKKQLCDIAYSDSKEFRIFAQRPLAGAWTLRAELQQSDINSHSNTVRSLLSDTAADRHPNSIHTARATSDANQNRFIASTKHSSYIKIAKESLQERADKEKSAKSASTSSFSVQIRTKLFSCNSATSNGGKFSPRNELLVYRLCGNSSFPLVFAQMKSERSSSSSTSGILSLMSNHSVELSIPALFPFSTSDNGAPSGDSDSARESLLSRRDSELEHDERKLITTNTAKLGHSAIFSSSFSPKNVLNVVGGMLHIQLKVTKPEGSSQSLAELIDEVEFIVSIRYGGLPRFPFQVYHADEDNEGGNIEFNSSLLAESPNSYSLFSSSAKVFLPNGNIMDNSVSTDGDENEGGSGGGDRQRRFLRRQLAKSDRESKDDALLILWVKDKPLLPPLSDTELGDIYVRVDVIRTAASSTYIPTAAPTVEPTVNPSIARTEVPATTPTPTLVPYSPPPSAVSTPYSSSSSSFSTSNPTASTVPSAPPTVGSTTGSLPPSNVPTEVSKSESSRSRTQNSTVAREADILSGSPTKGIKTKISTEAPKNSARKLLLSTHDVKSLYFATTDTIVGKNETAVQATTPPTTLPSTPPTTLPTTPLTTLPSTLPTTPPSFAPSTVSRDTIQVSLTLSFSYCSHDLCKNGGICTTQTGDISAAVCECKYVVKEKPFVLHILFSILLN